MFGWYDYHLYQFDIDDRCFEEPDEEAEGEDSTRARLSKLVTGPGQVFHYAYDFGDNWIHRIEVEDDDVSADPGWIPWLVDGERRGPPEDCGGVSGYQRLIEAVKAPPEALDEEDRAFVRWAGDDYDPEAFSVVAGAACVAGFGGVGVFEEAVRIFCMKRINVQFRGTDGC